MSPVQPAVLDRVLDADSHEMASAHFWGPLFGAASGEIAARLKPFISMLPSEYISRNVRVTLFNEVEPVARDFDRYPNLSDCYCYSTDYPHVEGGKNSKQEMHAQVAPLGETVVEKFFVKNAELLLP
jgi:hypothetical protein